MAFEPTQHQDDAEQVRARQLSLDQDQPPTDVPGYQLHRVLGSGAYGQVWVGIDETTGRQVAVKFYFHRGGVDWSLLSQEVEKLVFMSSDRYVVQLLDVGWSANPPYYVMEYLEKGSLEDHLERAGPLPVEEAVDMTTDLAIGLVHAHTKGVFHCDLKPANVLLDLDDKPRLADFGQSRLSDDQTPALGTLFYMAPEQADLEASPDARWDVYGLGALLFTMLTGQPPHRDPGSVDQIEQAPDLAQRLLRYRQMIEQQDLASRTIGRTGLDRALLEIIDRCLAVNPADRYASPRAVLAALEARQRNRARRPLVMLGVGVPLVLLMVMVFLSGRWYSQTMEEAKLAVRDRAYENNSWVARHVARSVEDEIESYFNIVKAESSRPELLAMIQQVLETEPLRALADRTQAEQADDDQRELFLSHPARTKLLGQLKSRLQIFLERLSEDPLKQPKLASMFIVDAKGTMLAVAYANPERVSRSAGNNYCWRTYFHGGPRDLDRSLNPQLARPISSTHLSAAFKSTTTQRWKVAISTPIMLAEGGQSVQLGVMAITVDLGDFVTLRSENLGNQKAVFLDGRDGAVLQHPDMRQLDQEGAEETFRVTPEDLDRLRKPGARLYVDPVARALSASQSDDRWIASAQPVKLPGSDSSSDDQASPLIVLVQENYSAATDPVNALGQRLSVEGSIALGVLVLIFLGLGWAIARR